ncbi:MAG: AbrB/MazE/SpoVT family DNA-binding domain-containing protein [Bdellovibrionales bacterium]|nr:AbrB/MazE/SpoVT family DNA-binding domain-containing protein [Bdellovibrionales bacterium]
MKETTLFMNGSSQAVRIPKEMRLSGDKVLIEKIGSVTVIVEQSDPWASLTLAQALFSKDFMKDGRSINEIVERPELSAGLKR